MLGPSCLVRNTALLDDLKSLVEYIAYEQIANDKSASVQSIYNIVRASGIEIDLQSIGHIYNEALPKTYQNIQSIEEVNDYVLKNYKDAIERASLLEDESDGKEKQIGQDKPEIYVVNGLLNMFTDSEVQSSVSESDFLKMQNALWKGIQRKLNLPESKKPTTKEQWKDILNRALGYEQLGITDINGRLNSIADLYDAMRDQLADAKAEMGVKADDATMERWEEMVNELEASTYSLLFSKGEAKSLLEGMMKEAGFGKELKNGKTILNWNKLASNIGSIQDLRKNVEKVLEDNGFNQNVIEGVKNSLENEFNELQARVLAKKIEIAEKEAARPEKELSAREKAIGRASEQKSDLKRLAELNNLGVFKSTHDAVMYNLIGVSDLQQADIDDLEILSKAASNLFREIDNNYGSDIFASRHLQILQRHIDSIIGRNINNKTIAMKIVSVIEKLFDILLTGLLMRPFTLLENIISGNKENIVPILFGKGLKKEDLEIYRKMLSDVSLRGQSFGEEIGNFAPRQLYTNMLKWKWKDGTAKERAESLLYLLMLPGRIGLMGFDSANKVTITNKTFNNAIYKALTQDRKNADGTIIKGMKPDDATKFMNEALYGKSFEQAKTDAKDLIESINKTLPDKYKVPVNSRTITTFANDLVKHNLNAGGALSNEVIEAAHKSAYHVAGYGLGHEANNIFSSAIKGYRDKRKREGERLSKDKDWDKLAKHRLFDSLVNGMVVRFTGGATNWVYLRIQSGWGVGLLTGFMGKWNRDIDFKDKRSIQNSIRERENRRNMIGRSLVGISYTALGYAVGYGLWAANHGGDDDENKKKLAAIKKQREDLAKQKAESGHAFEKAEMLKQYDDQMKALEASINMNKAIKSNWMASRLFKKTAPDVMLFSYYFDTERNKTLGFLRYMQNTTGLGSDFSISGQAMSAINLAGQGDIDGAKGILGNMFGSRLGLPVWSAGKDWYKLVDWIGGGKPTTDYKAPTNFSEGLWGGGALEDLGVFKRNPNILTLPGIGPDAYGKFKEQGIENYNDLKKIPNWWDMKYKVKIESAEGEEVEGGSEKEHYIIRSAPDRLKAKNAFEKYQKQN